MRIPLAFSELGYWHKIGQNCYFIQEDISSSYCKKTGSRLDTWENFKKEYPYTVSSNGSQVRYRTKVRK